MALSSKVRFLKRIFIDRMEVGKGKVVIERKGGRGGSFGLDLHLLERETLRIFERVLVGLHL